MFTDFKDFTKISSDLEPEEIIKELGVYFRKFDEITENQNPIDHKLDTGKIMDMDKAISKLPTGARSIFVLHDIEGYKHTEIAEMTGLAVGTSKTQLHRERKLLKGWL